MKKYSLRRRAFSVVLGVLFVFLQFLDVSPTFAFLDTVSTSCERDPVGCEATFGVVRSSVGTAGAASPYVTPTAVGLTTADKIAIVGSLAAFGYMTNQNMENLRKQAIANAPIKYPAGTYLFAPNGSGSGAVMGICVTPCSLSHSGLVDGYDFGYKDGFFLGKGYPNQLMVIRDADGNPPSPLNPSLSDA
ncbi:hypothetical protein, partial [Pseudanabaena sp. 'Roaring Creek']|uniref:hypothetical protein n=1 Tax=Pseudanabaena sp. 'Roaring Creek' TaxID=1681830 RepID=UPI0012E1CCE2